MRGIPEIGINTEKPADCHASLGDILELERGHDFSSGRPHLKRRPKIDPEKIEEWRNEII
jgi:hypothetical protein